MLHVGASFRRVLSGAPCRDIRIPESPDHQKPLEFYRDYKGILVTDGLQQYHLVDKKLPDVTNANCWAHARRDFADAVKAMDKKDPSAGHSSVAYTALQKIGGFYTADTELKKLSSE